MKSHRLLIVHSLAHSFFIRSFVRKMKQSNIVVMFRHAQLGEHFWYLFCLLVRFARDLFVLTGNREFPNSLEMSDVASN